MRILFCADPRMPEMPDPLYMDEVAAATRAGVPHVLLHYDALVNQHNVARAIRDVPVQPHNGMGLYRGWALNLAQYTALYDALLSRKIRLITSPAQYRHTQYLPEHYEHIQEHSPRTIWLESEGTHIPENLLRDLLLPFAGRALVLRDFVKCEKHHWNEACYIPSASEEATVKRVIQRFVELRGEHLTGGLVFREFVPFQTIGDSQSRHQAPLFNEFRIFYWRGTALITVKYWEEEPQAAVYEPPPQGYFDDIAQHVRSSFFTMDVAQRTDGQWMVIDLGDGQIARFPTRTDVNPLYQALANLAP